MNDQIETTAVEQIVIEQVREEDGSTCWGWDAFGVEERIAGGHAKTLSMCLDSMRGYLKAEGIAP